MKKLKISVVAILLITMLLTMTRGVFAYEGVGDVDPEYKISMPGSLTNGTGTVSGVSGMSYQFVEISQEKYATIKKLEAEYELIEVYVRYAKFPTDEGLTQEYNAACDKYEAQYSERVTDVYNKYPVDREMLTLARNEWIHELTNFDPNNWETATGNTISIDLSTFEGTKYFIAWVRNADGIYDAEVYQVTGTKVEDNKPDDKKPDDNKPDDKKPEENKPDDKKPEENKPNDNKPEENKPTTPNNTTKATPKTDNTTATKIIPKTGVSTTLLALISIAGVATATSYIRYRRIK